MVLRRAGTPRGTASSETDTVDPDIAASPPPTVHESSWDELGPRIAYRVAALRAAVFVVEQQCWYLDLDGRDLEPGARHLWIGGPGTRPSTGSTHHPDRPDRPAGPDNTDSTDSTDSTVVATLRLLPEREGWRIGRVATDPARRGEGLAAALIRVALARPGPFVLDAQSHFTVWYGRFGFRLDGSVFVEDGIPHTPMRRP